LVLLHPFNTFLPSQKVADWDGAYPWMPALWDISECEKILYQNRCFWARKEAESLHKDGQGDVHLEFGKFLAKTIPRAQTEWQKYGWVILSL
jgi:hypothetical protein